MGGHDEHVDVHAGRDARVVAHSQHVNQAQNESAEQVLELYIRMSAQEILDYATDFEEWAGHPNLALQAPGLRLAASVLRFAIGNSATFPSGVRDELAENASPAGDPPVS